MLLPPVPARLRACVMGTFFSQHMAAVGTTGALHALAMSISDAERSCLQMADTDATMVRLASLAARVCVQGVPCLSVLRPVSDPPAHA